MAKVKRKKTGRKIKLGLAGAPLLEWSKFFDYMRYEVDSKEIASIIKTHIKKEYKGADRKVLLAAPEYAYNMSIGAAASIHWSNLDKTFPPNWNPTNSIKLALDNIRHFASKKQDNTSPKRVSPAILAKKKVGKFIASVEYVVDHWEDHTDYSIYEELQKGVGSQSMAKSVYIYYKPELEELQELVNKKTPDLVEAYSHMTIRQRRAYMKFIEGIVKGSEQYMLNKKVNRKPRMAKPVTMDRQVAKLNYLPESKEYKLTSIVPYGIVGSMRLYTFNTSNRILTEYVSQSANGFEVRGSTLQLWDKTASRSTKLRKPEDILTIVQGSTVAKINRTIKGLTTKITKPNGRINKHTILVRVMNK